jgi:hypothetical protein
MVNLKPKTITIRSLDTDFLKENRINIRPKYQREICWKYEDMLKMLETFITRGFVQNFFIYELPNRIDTFDYECVDGQHRITVIKYYIENIPINNQYLYYEDPNTKQKVFYKITPEIKKKYKSNIRELNNETEKKYFLDVDLQMVFISDIPNEQYLCEQFNRLQNGRNTGIVDILKNIDHPLTNFLRNNDITRKNNVVNYWEDICLIKKIKDYNQVNDVMNKNIEIYTFLIIKLFYIIDKKDLNIVYDNKKITIYLDNRDKNVDIKGDINVIYEKINEFKNNIKGLLKEKIIPELFLILVHLYNTEPILFERLNKELFNNIISPFNIKDNYKDSSKFIENYNKIKEKINYTIKKID